MTTQTIRFLSARRRPRDRRASRPRARCFSICARIAHCTGTKEGCAEGDCGACTVVVGELDAHGALALKAVNACIQFLPTLDGRALFTVEDLRAADGALHPVQQALVDCHGSQCGFCTPGFVMSMWALYENQPRRRRPADPRRNQRRALRQSVPLHRLSADRRCRRRRCSTIRIPARGARSRRRRRDSCERTAARDTFEYSAPDARGAAFGSPTFHAPVTLDEFARLRAAHPNARLLAGSTDVGLWVTKQFRDLGDILYIGNVAELKTIERDAQTLTIGAAVIARRRVRRARRRLSRTRRTVDALRLAADPQRRHARRQRRERLADRRFDAGADRARRAKSCCDTADKTRTLPLDAFYLGYQKTALDAGEFVAAMRVPRPARRSALSHLQGVEALRPGHLGGVRGVRAAARRRRRVTDARIAFGGMAATPKRAAQAEAALIGRDWNEATARAAMNALDADFQPLTDMRASSAYRAKVARNLLWRFYLETRDDAPLALLDVNAFAFDGTARRTVRIAKEPPMNRTDAFVEPPRHACRAPPPRRADRAIGVRCRTNRRRCT